MARVVDLEVRELIPSTSLADLCPFITASDVLIDQMVASGIKTFSDATLKEVSRWLSAHFASVSDPTVAIIEEKVEGSTVKASRGNTSLSGVLSTQYGQMANTLSSGCLAELDKPVPTVSFI